MNVMIEEVEDKKNQIQEIYEQLKKQKKEIQLINEDLQNKIFPYCGMRFNKMFYQER